MNNDFDKVLLIPMGLVALTAILAICNFCEYQGIQKGEMNMKEAAVKANLAEWVADEDGKPEFRFKQ